jgi:hypothetical protein
MQISNLKELILVRRLRPQKEKSQSLGPEATRCGKPDWVLDSRNSRKCRLDVAARSLTDSASSLRKIALGKYMMEGIGV